MKNLSEAIQISSNTSDQILNETYERISNHIETDLWINVEDGYEENSYWMRTPPEDFDEVDEVGIIEIDINLNTFQKIMTVAHEVGHYFLDQDAVFGESSHTMFKESLAWYLGLDYIRKIGINIDPKEYVEEMNRCLELYVRSMNEQQD